MSNSIVIAVPHRLGAKEAKRRIAEQIELLRRNYIDKLAYSEANWNAALAGKIQSILKSNVEESLRIGHTPPKA